MLTAGWFLVIFEIKRKHLPEIVSDKLEFIISSDIQLIIYHLILILGVILLTYIAARLSRFLEIDTVKHCKNCTLADSEFLPSYLGYFFIALSVDDKNTIIAIEIYLILAMFIYLAKSQYFNPIYLLLGYHFYHVTTEKDRKFFLIAKGNVIKDPLCIDYEQLRRINDTTFITKE